ncbi:cytochrome c3 family protein [Desulfuromonas versatilis]|uniref:cytochrome c3 family protein n=1 Tax=Desulfuromonas versatilis TaxID=2802975 RepID=UPI001C85545A
MASAAGPESIVLEAKNGNVTLSHKMHGEQFGCPACHGEAAPGKFAPDKDWAHEVCKGCHQDKGAGPTKCGDCHKK